MEKISEFKSLVKMKSKRKKVEKKGINKGRKEVNVI